VLLLDEPLAALDKKLRKETQAELKRIQALTGATFIVVTHDQDEAMALSDRMAVMREGKIVQVDAPGVVYDRPANRYVAEFVGEVNLFPASVSAIKSGVVMAAVDGVQGIVTIKGDAATRGVSLALRPEQMRLASAEHLACDHWMACTVEDRTHLGASVSYRVRLTDGKLLHALVPSSGLEARHTLGAAIFAGFRASDARLLGD
jgi:ABC-type Fe3+/spermidine/putrescine transport system ATPase subunit